MIFVLVLTLRSWDAFALSYEQAVKAYASERYTTAAKIALKVAKKSEDTEKGRAYVIAGAAALEIGKKSLAKRFFKSALKADSEALLPSFVRNKKAKKLFAAVKETREGGSFSFTSLFGSDGNSSKGAFDEVSTYYPFGINQISQGKLFLGITVGALQSFAIFSAYKNLNDASALEQELVQVSENAKAVGDEKSPKYLEFLDSSQSYINQKKTSAYLSIAGVAILYGASVYEAGSSPPSKGTSKKSSKLSTILPLYEYKAQDLGLGWDLGELPAARLSLSLYRVF